MRPIRTDEELEQLKKNDDYLLHESLSTVKRRAIKFIFIALMIIAGILIILAFGLIGRYISLIWNDPEAIKNLIDRSLDIFLGGTITIVIQNFVRKSIK